LPQLAQVFVSLGIVGVLVHVLVLILVAVEALIELLLAIRALHFTSVPLSIGSSIVLSLVIVRILTVLSPASVVVLLVVVRALAPVLVLLLFLVLILVGVRWLCLAAGLL